MKRFKPLSDRILVRRCEEADEKGLYIPDNELIEDVVVSTGPGRVVDGELLNPHVKSDDRVLFNKYAAIEINLNGIEHLILRDDDVFGTLSDE